ncbi:MAG: hypothetical protein K2N05_05855 [Muribaculaceae bacterium]|nr:hypothetical protein [Muribaculaceae bacterium]
MAFNFKSIGDIANAVSSAKNIVTGASELVSTVKGNQTSKETDSKPENLPDGLYPERIEKLIRFALAEGELDADGIEMLEKAAVKEGLDPDEVVFVAKKRLKHSIKSAPRILSPAQELAESLSSINSKFDSAIEAIRMGDSSGASSILDAVTGGASGLVVSLGKSIFGKSDDEKILELEQLRDEQRARIITATTLPNNELHVVELLEYVYTQTKAKHGDWDGDERKAWKSLHQSVYNRAQMMVSGDFSKVQYIETLKPAKKKFGLF